MKLLLDTHSLIWFLWADPRLSSSALHAISDPANTAYFSPASLWELAIKVSTGKLTLKLPFDDFAELIEHQSGLTPTPISMSAIRLVARLSFHHRDPFDRIITAQALVEGMSLVSVDAIHDAYGIRRLW